MAAAAKPVKVGVKTYARVRCFFPDREKIIRGVLTQSAAEANGKGTLTTLASETDHVRPMTTQFTDVLGEKTVNEDLYNSVCVPMIETTLQGYKALLIAYGQTGSGKTFTLIGAKGPGQLGLLPRTLQTLLDHSSVLKIRMKAFEAYGMGKILIYDLFNEKNLFSFKPFVPPYDNKAKNKAEEYKWVQKKAAAARSLWDDKFGKTIVDTMNAGGIKDVETVEDGFRLVDEAHDASHFAKTGKNPESSRGHTVYILYVDIVNPQGADFNPLLTQFICVDLAGSEGSSTLDALPDGPEKTIRFMEGGAINMGLSSLKDMFGEMRKKGKLKPVQGNGLRKLLYPFVSSNTMMSFVFCLSPSLENIMATRATMRFAADACKLKMKPIAASGGKNFQKLYEKLKLQMDEKQKMIDELNNTMNEAMSGGAGDGGALATILSHMCYDKQDGVKHLFADYDVNQYLDPALLEEVEEEIIARREAYGEKLEGMYSKSKKASKKKGKALELIDKAMSRGLSMHDFYVLECARIGQKPEKREQKSGESRVLAAAEQGNDEKKNAWLENSKRMQEKAAELENEMAELEEMENEAGTGGGAVDLLAMANAEPIFSGNSVELVEIDNTIPPDVWMDMSEETKSDLKTKAADPQYVKFGQITEAFEILLKTEFKIDQDTAEHLFGFLLYSGAAKSSQAHVDVFTAGMDAEDLENLPKILEMQTRITTLETQVAVEKSMKMWSSMRLKVRERKFKQMEAEANQIKEEAATKTANEVVEMMAVVEKKNMELTNLFGKLEGNSNALKQNALIMNNQAQTIAALQQQVFMTLHFPKKITVSGREGFNDNMNGVYTIGTELHEGRVCYQHIENAWVVRWHEAKRLWIMDHRGLKEDDTGSACVDDDAQHPMLVQKDWIVYNGEEFVVDSNISFSGEFNMPNKVEGGKRAAGNFMRVIE